MFKRTEVVSLKLRRMVAAQISGYAGRGVELKEVGMPKMAANQVLIRVRAAGVNPIDWKIKEGYSKLPVPATLGVDVSGVIEEVGEDVEGFGVGDEVFGMIPAAGEGSFAEFAKAEEGFIALKPKTLTFTEAAAIPLTGLSAWQVLFDQAKLASGQRILIHGGGGGIGSFAVQLAKNIGATVATTVSTSKVGYAKGLGADLVIDYTREKFEDKVKGYDVVFDTVGGDTYLRSYSVLRRGGVIVSMLEMPNEELMKKYSVVAKNQFTRPNSGQMAELARLADEGILRVNVSRTFPLGEANSALEYLKNQHPMGKVVISVAE